ncbi:hypothetical protein EDC18_103306 [Natranaerovirga pectinivora]|uniref:Lipoprotein n=1 Tax=Natranaerovirga pectinivora TaxID=682400 RepID=A0A4R3MLQ6_9FIRM|nr:hypothetical protein [Natranaerovirga pectinivora]TCT15598.1 hypothetical protein EDC18_103306 [Natranaerovirga pectinivora]
MKYAKLKTLLLIGIFIIISIGCENKSSESSIVIQNYHERIGKGTDSQFYKNGFEYSYYYYIDKDHEVTLEMVIKHEGKEFDNIVLTDIKRNIGDIDGAFGLSAKIDEKNDSIIWALRLDENVEYIISPDFLKNSNGSHGSLSDYGSIEGSTVFSSGYNQKNSNYTEYE